MGEGLASRHCHFFRFCIVGVLTTLVYIFMGGVLTEEIHLSVVFATNTAFIIAVIVNYILHYSFTFKKQSNHTHSLPRFLITVSLGGGVNTFIIWIGVSELSFQLIWAQLVAIVVITASNYMFFKFWVFSENPASGIKRGEDDIIIS